MLEVRDDGIEPIGVEHAVLDEHRLDRGDPSFHRRERRRMVRVTVVAMFVFVMVVSHGRAS